MVQTATRPAGRSAASPSWALASTVTVSDTVVLEFCLWLPLSTETAAEDPPKKVPLGKNLQERSFIKKELDTEGDIDGAEGINAYHFGWRMYDPQVGVWWAADPNAQFWSSYCYTGNGVSPITGVDADGRDVAVFSRPVLGSPWNHLAAVVYNRGGGKAPVTISLVGNPLGGKHPSIVLDHSNDWQALLNAEAGVDRAVIETQIVSEGNPYLDEAVIEAAMAYTPDRNYPRVGGIFQREAFNSNTFMHQFMLDFGFSLNRFWDAVHQLAFRNLAPLGDVWIGGNVGVQIGPNSVEWLGGEEPPLYTP